MSARARLGRSLVLVVLAVGVASCSGGGPGPATARSPREAPQSGPSDTEGADPSPSPVPTQSPPPRFRPADEIETREGFRAEVFATGLVHPTAMAYGPDGALYVTQDTGEVVIAAPASGDPELFVDGLRTPLGLVWLGRSLFVSEQGRLTRFRMSGDGVRGPEAVLEGLPFGLHQQDTVVVGPDGRLYLGSGSTCNRCREEDRRSAAILSLTPDGGDLKIVATGLRNPFGLAFQPGTGQLFATVNGVDYIGSDDQPEPAELLVAIQDGAWYGWPTCWPSFRTLSMRGDCEGVEEPVAYLEPHSSADGLVFYTGSSFPARYRGDALVAEWGEYYATTHGRRVDRVVLPEGDELARVSWFADGFEHPLAVTVDPWGGLLVADWGRGVIYRIQYGDSP